VVFGIGKISGDIFWAINFDRWGLPEWFIPVVGWTEIVGATLLLIPRVSYYGAILLFGVMLGALYAHFIGRDGIQMVRPLAFMAALYFIARKRRPPRKKPPKRERKAPAEH
jgi:putative oxidoreductase